MNGTWTAELVRAVAPDGPPVASSSIGAEVHGFAGDSVLVAVLAARNALRQHEFSDEARAGFCLMGACQDCWVWLADGTRACAPAPRRSPTACSVLTARRRSLAR